MNQINRCTITTTLLVSLLFTSTPTHAVADTAIPRCAIQLARINGSFVMDPMKYSHFTGENGSGIVLVSNAWTDGNSCRHFDGNCTGGLWWFRPQSISAPNDLSDPASLVTEQRCGGGFQYPWIVVCPGQAPVTGCGFCLW